MIQPLRHGGNDLENIADNAKMGGFENRRFPVPLNGDNKIPILHSHQVLDRPGNPPGDISFWPDGLAGLAYLSLIGHSPVQRSPAMHLPGISWTLPLGLRIFLGGDPLFHSSKKLLELPLQGGRDGFLLRQFSDQQIHGPRRVFLPVAEDFPGLPLGGEDFLHVGRGAFEPNLVDGQLEHAVSPGGDLGELREEPPVDEGIPGKVDFADHGQKRGELGQDDFLPPFEFAADRNRQLFRIDFHNLIHQGTRL